MRFFLLVPFALALAAPATADVFDVTRADDPVPDGCLAADCSLREALEAAQATPGPDTILLGAGQYFVTRGDLAVFGNVTIEGAGRDATDLVASGSPAAMRVAAQSRFVLRDLAWAAIGGTAVAGDADQASITLERVDVPVGEVVIGTGSGGEGDLQVRHAEIGQVVGCLVADGVCEVSDSRTGFIAAMGERVALHVSRCETTRSEAGVIAYGGGTVLVEDSTIRGAARPLEVLQFGVPEATDVIVRRTRFIGNTGPLRVQRAATVRMDDVEFRDNVVAGDSLAEGDPAVLLADAGAAWRINRALFVGNRGGSGLDGAVVRVLGGANVVMNQVTFDDNTFHPDAGSGFGHSIGVYANSAEATVFWLFHATLRAAPSLPAGTQGSVLTVRGGTANVRVFNSLVHGSCAFGGGGVLFQAEGNIESPGDTCGLDGSNEVDVAPIQLHLGALGDHGGFTHTYLPALGSAMIDQAKATWCLFAALDQRRHLRPVDGESCDIGAVEAGAPSDSLFADGFDV
ncbi:MAG: hypothetical protein EOP90_11450 [Lysobacteraceae bacterium]|nr:MAG: hypothetical protein EOP90_11450 [Xanthomonadaceae bacterium]